MATMLRAAQHSVHPVPTSWVGANGADPAKPHAGQAGWMPWRSGDSLYTGEGASFGSCVILFVGLLSPPPVPPKCRGFWHLGGECGKRNAPDLGRLIVMSVDEALS